MKRKVVHKKLTFQSRLERLAPGINYFALSVPEKISKTLGTRGPVPIAAHFNDSEAFQVNLYPVGGGQHALRVKSSIRNAAKIKEGDRVSVTFTVRDRLAKILIPKDLSTVLRAEGALESFNSLPPGKKAYILQLIAQAARPQTREKRIQKAVEEARRQSKK